MAHCYDDTECERRYLLRDLISRERWDKKGPTVIDYYVNNFHVTKPSFFPDIQTGSDRWNYIPRNDAPEEDVNFHLQYAGSTNRLAGSRDRQNIVSWLGMEESLIVARVFTYHHRNNGNWIVEQDIGFNYYHDFALHSAQDDYKFCVLQTAVHEFGHFVKLRDMPDNICDDYRRYTMYYANYPGLHLNESPQCEDKWGVWYTYHQMRWVNYAPPALDFPPAEQHPASKLQTRLLQNYPDPFNPETWIPFELANDANLSINIYDSNGRLVRILALGDTPRGSYVKRAKAVHWDGKNDNGENVASGMYFYTLQTENETATDKYGFAQTRRMVILK